MKLLKQQWTAEEADRWTVHELLACIFGVMAFVLVSLGVAGTLLLQGWGFFALGLAFFFSWLTYKVIDPKLRALSQSYEKKQASFLESVNKHNRWER